MKPIVVLSPGLPRSGTTYTFHSLMSGTNRDLFNVPKTKEINFFTSNGTVEEFLSHFHDNDNESFYIDYSPSYLTSPTSLVDNILDFRKDLDFKVILHLRHPVDQMYAHYLHDVKAHVSKRQWGDDVRYSFFSVKSLKKYLALRSSAVQKLVENFGAENVLTVSFYEDIPNPSRLKEKIGRFLGVSLTGFPEQKVSPGGWIPYYIYGGEEGVEVTVGSDIKILRPRSLLLVNGRDSCIWHDVEESVAGRLIEGSSTWTRELSREQFSDVYSALKDDWEKTLRFLGEDPSAYEKKKALQANPAPMDDTVLDLIDGEGLSLVERLNSCSYRVS